MARPTARLRWIALLLAAGVLVVVSDVLFTWRELTASPSTRSASPATVRAIYDAVARANDSADVQELAQFVDQLSESEAADLLHKINATPATTSKAPALRDDDTLRLETEQMKAEEVQNSRKESEQKQLESKLLFSLHNVTQRTSQPRGLVLPLFDDLAPLGLSLVLDLRALGVTLPVEIPHCGDLDAKLASTIARKTRQLGDVFVYDACELAANETSLLDPSKKLFCKDLADCHSKFRSFDIKVLGVVYSRFEELMVLDADALLMQNPMPLWETDKYRTTGTLFFNDRISQTNFSLGYRPAARPETTDLQEYLSKADVTVFRMLPTLSRAKASSTEFDVFLPFEPSDTLLNSHVWKSRSGHQMDSSLLLWNKKRQPRATAVLASFISLNDVARPPSYGDKELFFVACELAETQYSFSDFAVGAAGSDFKDSGEDKSIICGQAAQYYPVKPQDTSNVSLLYLNSNSIMAYKPKSQPLYFSKARDADYYPGAFTDRSLPQECPFDVTGIQFSPLQVQRVLLRQRFHDIAVEWERNALMSASETEQTQANELVNTKLDALLKQVADEIPFDESTAAPKSEPVATATPATTVPQTTQAANMWGDFMNKARERAEIEKLMETRLIHSLNRLSQETTDKRGIVLPLYDKITALGVSVILQLRSLGVDLPIEIPHCGDFDDAFGASIMEKTEQLGDVFVYNACERAVSAKSLLYPEKPLFCKDLKDCHARYRNFSIKILGVIYSRFEEVMLLDADALLFKSPMPLWGTKKYQTTGTLFFNDRIAEANFSMGLGYRPANRPDTMAIEDYLSKANVDLFRYLPTLQRPNASAELIAADKSKVTLHFQPSEGLLKSHPWNGRSAHRVDSSLLLWNKKRQPRATAILASFISQNDVRRPPSYGDKELFFVACELAETLYTFSDFSTGSAGSDFRDKGVNKSIVCGSAAHHFPEKSDGTPIGEVSLLYMNSDYIMRYKPKKAPMYYSAARPRDFFPGKFEDHGVDMRCPFDITGVKFTEAENQQIYQRQHFHDISVEWENNAKEPNKLAREAADSLTNGKLAKVLEQIKSGSSFEDRTDPPKDPKKEEEEKKQAELKKKADELEKQEKQLVHTLNQIAQHTTVKRGIVIPVYDGIIKLAASLILELRTIGISEPVELPHCGDVDPEMQKMLLQKKQLGTIWLYNVCDRAFRATSALDSSRRVFCATIEDCHAKFRGFIIKPLSVTFSRFEEIMLIDADTTFFVSPALLWDSEKYKKTGNFLMHDRISHEKWFMAERVPGNPNVSLEQEYFSKFDVTPFRSLPTMERPKATLTNPSEVTLNFEPSDFLFSSHSFNIRAGHQVDSSLVLWDKKRQPRATAILASFIALNDIKSPPAYGDKEFFFYASELAETQYSFSDHAIGAVGTDFQDGGPKNSTLCGDMAQVFPIHQDGVPDDDVPLFYFNSDRILWFRPEKEPVYYMKARPWEFYPGAFGERRQECPFGITVGKLSKDQERHLAGRQHIYEAVDAWFRVEKERPANLADQHASIDTVLAKSIAEMQGKNPDEVTPAPVQKDQVTAHVDATQEAMEKQLAYTLSQITQRTTTKRGILMPLYEPIVKVGLSLILELRAMGITLPIEVPHCTDLKSETVELIRTKTELGEIHVYDVCALASKATSVLDPSRQVFCANIEECQKKFRSFMIKPLAVSYSRFEEILMLDADTTFFVNPTVLFDSDKFKTTGNLLMHDRISHDWWFMAERLKDEPDISVELDYFSKFDVTPFRPLPTMERPKTTLQNPSKVTLSFEPSDFLFKSHSFNLRSGHQVDSSLVMWDKKRQPRATTILAAFVANNDIASPPSYGDKELFFYASELAETQYSFSDHAIGAVGTKLEDGGPKNSTLCGDMAQVFPIHQDGVPDDDVPLFYFNSDRILHFKPDVETVYYMKARPWEHYPGRFGSRPQECPFNITAGALNEAQINHLAERRKFHEQVKAWW